MPVVPRSVELHRATLPSAVDVADVALVGRRPLAEQLAKVEVVVLSLEEVAGVSKVARAEERADLSVSKAA